MKEKHSTYIPYPDKPAIVNKFWKGNMPSTFSTIFQELQDFKYVDFIICFEIFIETVSGFLL